MPIYGKVFAQIKEWAPKLDSLSYKPWSDEVKKRVADWIEIVESGNDPETMSIEELHKLQGLTGDKTENNGDGAEKKTETKVEDSNPFPAASTEADETSDLPF